MRVIEDGGRNAFISGIPVRLGPRLVGVCGHVGTGRAGVATRKCDDRCLEAARPGARYLLHLGRDIRHRYVHDHQTSCQRSAGPTFLVSHLTLLFAGAFGTFTVEAQITETLTADPAILVNEGRWVIVDGTGAYATLHGEGEVIGIVNDTLNLITRTFRGVVHFD